MSYSFLNFQSVNGPQLQLVKVTSADLPDLAKSLVSPTTWFSLTRGITSTEAFCTYFQKIIEKQSRGEVLMVAAKFNGQFVASSVYQYPNENFRRVEIGFTWVADKWQKTFVNSELKLLMLDYAFNVMKVNRVEFSVHPTNEKSNRAMKRLGATLEGTLRKWRYIENLDDGNRNIYSIIDDEWPRLRSQLIIRS